MDQLGFDLRIVTLDGAQDGEVPPHLRPTNATVAPPRPPPPHPLIRSPAHLLPATRYMDMELFFAKACRATGLKKMPGKEPSGGQEYKLRPCRSK